MADQLAIKPPRFCTTMEEVRSGVDAIDRALVTLVAERQKFMEQAARIKKDRDEVRDEARIRDVLDKVLAQAKKKGLSEAIAEPVWRSLIERSIAHEMEVFDALRSRGTPR